MLSFCLTNIENLAKAIDCDNLITFRFILDADELKSFELNWYGIIPFDVDMEDEEFLNKLINFIARTDLVFGQDLFFILLADLLLYYFKLALFFQTNWQRVGLFQSHVHNVGQLTTKLKQGQVIFFCQIAIQLLNLIGDIRGYS